MCFPVVRATHSPRSPRNFDTGNSLNISHNAESYTDPRLLEVENFQWLEVFRSQISEAETCREASREIQLLNLSCHCIMEDILSAQMGRTRGRENFEIEQNKKLERFLNACRVKLVGDSFFINLLDMFGFECYPKNSLEQLFVNTVNEQLQYHYNQRVFAWEMQEQIEEGIPLQSLQYYDNKPTIDELMTKPDGLLYIIDESNKNSQGASFIVEKLQSSPKGPRVKMSSSKEFSVAHYTGKIAYDLQDIPSKNRDFLPPEMIETMRLSNDNVLKQLFTNQLSKSGNLTIHSDQSAPVATGKKKRWGQALVAEKSRRFNTSSRGEYSQTRRMRTASATFRAASLELLRNLAIGQDGCVTMGGTHFVRCIRADLTGHPHGFQPEVVRQQLRALAVIDTARARQKGYSHRVGFAEFIRRYKFLAFDFDENVEVTKDNCRLLLVRLKMEGWVIGKSKVFLKYYNEEFLSRLYETQVKKIVKVQCMMRAFLAKRNFKGKMKARQSSLKHKSVDEPGDEPAGASGNNDEIEEPVNEPVVEEEGEFEDDETIDGYGVEGNDNETAIINDDEGENEEVEEGAEVEEEE
ncbi:Myosin-IIIa [Homalodisca vitripennis]|nr:Myosin-IIIa [Homalodisca vitripennis]